MPDTTIHIEKIKNQIQESGFIYLENQNFDLFESISKQLGSIILNTEVRIVPEASAKVQTAEPLEWHQDSPEAKWLAWFCKNPGQYQNEPTEVFNSKILFDHLSEEEIVILSNIKTTIRMSNNQEKVSRIITQSANGEKALYFCPWLTGQGLDNFAREAINKLSLLINRYEKHKNQFFWKKNDILIIDNQMMLHRRSLLNPASNRFLIRHWISNE